MKPIEITASQSVRVNLGDYQGVEFFVSMKTTPDEGESPLQVSRALRRRVNRALIHDISANFKARGRPITEEQIARRFGLSKGVEE